MRSLFWTLIRAFLFLRDAEKVHLSMVKWTRRLKKFNNGTLLRVVSGAEVPSKKSVNVSVFGVTFSSPLGLAAGFDKNAELVSALPHLGFGFAEVGTVTPRPQPGNPLPRLFRDSKNQSLFNCMGFNGLGAESVSQGIYRAREKGSLPDYFRVGVNIGKNKETPNDQAFEDYAQAVKPFVGLVDYVVINVSSPNTPGLRDLQNQLEELKKIVESVKEQMSQWSFVPPLLIKLAPEVSVKSLEELIVTLESWGIQGWVMNNTLAGSYQVSQTKTLSGGWSGHPLTTLSLEKLKQVRKLTQRPIISVGGILTPQDAEDRLKSGADLIQIYSGWVFKGPSFPKHVIDRLTEFLSAH